MTMNTLHMEIKEQPYGTRIHYVAVRSPAGRDRAVVPVPCYLASTRRIRRVSRAVGRPMRRISPCDISAVASVTNTSAPIQPYTKAINNPWVRGIPPFVYVDLDVPISLQWILCTGNGTTLDEIAQQRLF